ncbi:MAG: DUF1573 domain-containing protein [Blastocatellia bacterium]
MKLFRSNLALALTVLITLTAAAQEKKPPGQNGGTGAGAAPKLVIASLTHDFGEVKSGTPLRYAFKIKNEGKADLVINSVSPG